MATFYRGQAERFLQKLAEDDNDAWWEIYSTIVGIARGYLPLTFPPGKDFANFDFDLPVRKGVKILLGIKRSADGSVCVETIQQI